MGCLASGSADMEDYINILGGFGALGLITLLFVRGDLVSMKTVKEILKGRNQHIESLEETMEKTVGDKLDKMIDLLQDIKKNGAMKGG